MNRNDLKIILAEVCEDEITELNKFPPFKPSLRHKLAMKRIFAAFEKNTRKAAASPAPSFNSPKAHKRLSTRLIILLAAIVCAALLTGFMIVYISSFHRKEYIDNTQLFAINTEGGMPTIKYQYFLSGLPDVFEFIEQNISSYDVYTKYKNKSSGQAITFTQCTKNKYDSHYNTEKYNFEEVEINGHNGLCINFVGSESAYLILIWDNNDFILELTGDLTKEDLINLAKNTKVLEN